MNEWIDMSAEHPPIGKLVLVFCGTPDWPMMQTSALNYGRPPNNPALLYWDCGSDFDEVTHWMRLPTPPAAPFGLPEQAPCPAGEFVAAIESAGAVS